MPYINQEQRDHLDKDIDHIVSILNSISGDRGLDGNVNYIITQIVNRAYNTPYANYKTLSKGVAAFECAKLEYYRRVMVPYEEEKIRIEGDVY